MTICCAAAASALLVVDDDENDLTGDADVDIADDADADAAAGVTDVVAFVVVASATDAVAPLFPAPVELATVDQSPSIALDALRLNCSRKLSICISMDLVVALSSVLVFHTNKNYIARHTHTHMRTNALDILHYTAKKKTVLWASQLLLLSVR